MLYRHTDFNCTDTYVCLAISLLWALRKVYSSRVLQCTGIFSNFQYLMHTGMNNYVLVRISCVLKIT